MRKETKEKIKKAAASFKDAVLQAFFPRVCPLCGEILTEKNRYYKNPYICRYCYGKLNFAEGQRCMLCSTPLSRDDAELCKNCRKKKRYFDGGYGLLLHDESAKKIIYPLKYKSRVEFADFLAFEAALRLGGLISEWKIDAAVPVPLHKKRKRERGYNQSEVLAEKMLKIIKDSAGMNKSGKEVLCPRLRPELLRRVNKTRPMKDLGSDARILNVKGVFRAVSPEIRGMRILLADDIFTSGATINECAKALKSAGACAVYFITMSIGSDADTDV